MSNEISKKSDIKFTVSLDENKVPAAIDWTAEDSGMNGNRQCKAVLLGLWDAEESAALRIDLWTKEMNVDEMKQFFYETFMGLADTYQRATDEKDVANEIRSFGEKFSKLAGIK